MSIRFHGRQRDEILDRLVTKWLPSGPPVAILQGFPGCGKTQLALAVAANAPRSLDPEEPLTESADPVTDLFLNLAVALEAHGLPALVQEIDKGDKAKLDKALLNLLRHEQILIVVDEFQRLLPTDKSTPPQVWAKLIEDINNSPHAQGRLLLISNRVIKIERWSENCLVEEIQGLPDQEAEALFTELLESKRLEAAVPPERRREIVHRLGGNPRALKTLVYGLRTDTLDDLLSTTPDLLKPGDVVLNSGLLVDFEREVLERALPKLEADLLKFMRWLSVHRRPFKKEALAQFTAGRGTPDELRKQLFDRFLLEHTGGGDVPHPLAREISVNRLRTEGREWVQAHNLAANYYFRYFKARQVTGAANLATSYTELRHHLHEAGRSDELYEASEKLTQYAISRIGFTTQIPTHPEALEERIAFLSALTDDRRPKVLEYHLARCLLKRGKAADKERALIHARRATVRQHFAPAWALRLQLEYELKGFDTTRPVISEALRSVRADDDARVVYQRGAELMAKANRLDDAIKLLEKGIAVPGMASLVSLYQTAVELTERAGDHSKAESLVVKGLSTIPQTHGRHKIAQTALRLFSTRRDVEAVQRLLNGTGTQQLDPPQRALAKCLLHRLSGDWAKVVEVAREKRADLTTYTLLRTHAADACLALGRAQEADDLMKDYQVGEQQVRDNPPVWLKAYVCLIAGRLDEARALAAMYAPNDFDSGRPLDEAEMLRLWSVARNGLNEAVEDSFPGLAEYRRRNVAQSQVEEKMPAAQASERISLLVVATEWDSHHGGLSTFNRDLCAALADVGARVVCYVPEASAEEKQRAGEANVEIVVAGKTPGAKDTSLLSQPPVLPAGFVPDVVIGHDRITGAASAALVRHHYPGSKRVLFIHTSPEEIEWHKEPREDSTGAARAAKRKQDQLDLAEGCALIVAVGPHLRSEFGTDLHGVGNRVPVMELTPGLPERPRDVAASPPPSIRCLILGRVEDYQLKGLDLAAKAFGRVVESWKSVNRPKLVVRGAPVGTDAALRQRLAEDSAPVEIDIIIRHYSANEVEVLRDLREASLVLMPSKKEGFGLVGLEAIACDVPTLISDQSGLAETVKLHAPQFANEWILPVTGDAVTKWAERIEYLLTGRESAFARAAALRESLARELNWKRAAVELLERLAPVRLIRPRG